MKQEPTVMLIAGIFGIYAGEDVNIQQIQKLGEPRVKSKVPLFGGGIKK